MESRQRGSISCWCRCERPGRGGGTHLRCQRWRGEHLHPADLDYFHQFRFIWSFLCIFEQSDDEAGEQMEGEDGAQSFFAHVPVPSQKEVCFTFNWVHVSCTKRVWFWSLDRNHHPCSVLYSLSCHSKHAKCKRRIFEESLHWSFQHNNSLWWTHL